MVTSSRYDDASTRGSRRSRSRSMDSSRRSCRNSTQSVRGSNRSSCQSSRSQISRKDAHTRKKELQILNRARTRQAGVQAMRLFITCLQATSLCVVLATVCYLAYSNYAHFKEYFYAYTGDLSIEIFLLGIVLLLSFHYGACFRWIFWICFAVTLLCEGLVLWLLLDRLNHGRMTLRCNNSRSEQYQTIWDSGEDPKYCPALANVPSSLQFAILHSFVIVVHALIFVLSFFWRACYEASMDHLKKTERGRRLIKKYSQPSPSRRECRSVTATSAKSARSTRSTSQRKRSSLPPGTVNTLKREKDDYACQIVRKDGSKQLAAVSASTSEIFTHSIRGCRKTVIKDKKVYAETTDGKVMTDKLPRKILQQDIDCNHDKFIMVKGQIYPDVECHGPQKSTAIEERATQTEKDVAVIETKATNQTVSESLRPAGRFNSVTKMPALESPVAALNKIEKKRQLDYKSQYAFQI